jgi:DNA processing protein
LFAVPGSPLDPRCRGSNDLIRQGAHLTEGADDVLANLPDDPRRLGVARNPLFARDAAGGFADELDLWDSPPEPEADLQSAQKALLNLLSPSPTELDELVRRSQLPAQTVMAALTRLELALQVEFLPGNRIVRL